jgi:hypothetical protein
LVWVAGFCLAALLALAARGMVKARSGVNGVIGDVDLD